MPWLSFYITILASSKTSSVIRAEMKTLKVSLYAKDVSIIIARWPFLVVGLSVCPAVYYSLLSSKFLIVDFVLRLNEPKNFILDVTL